ncbi:MAG: CatB-related O-acetyltransferase [Deferrisomatales bacterium]|nr:CatB-related O-acetyltransferase [Deferrisomatales bacterium]
MNGPDPTCTHPIPAFPRVCFLRNIVTNPDIQVGEYTYYDDPANPEGFERNVLYHYPFVGDRLIIGRFCAIAAGVTFLMNGANHRLGGISTHPFEIFGSGWEATQDAGEEPSRGDTVVGNDVWLGYRSSVLPGVQVGDGAVVAALAVVAADVPPYAVVAGNPARVVRRRFPEEVVEQLLRIAWWAWPPEKITRNLARIVSADVASLRNAV